MRNLSGFVHSSRVSLGQFYFGFMTSGKLHFLLEKVAENFNYLPLIWELPVSHSLNPDTLLFRRSCRAYRLPGGVPTHASLRAAHLISALRYQPSGS